MIDNDEEQLAALLAALPPAPPAWVEAAKELPAFRAPLEEVVARAEADLAFRRALVGDLEAALAAAGYESDSRLVDALRIRLRAE